MKALASDFDHTLFIDGQLLPDDLAAIKRFQSQRGLFGICTGRPLTGIIKPVGDAITFDFYILDSGALILDRNQRVIHACDLNHDLLARLCARFRDRCAIAILVEDTFYALYHINPVIHIPMPVLHHLDEVRDAAIFAVSLCARNEDEAHRVKEEIEAVFPEELSAFVNGIFVDVVAYGCSKGRAIDIVRDVFHISHMCGIGDNYNDLPMFSRVDTAYTFHDSPDDVKKQADRFVHSVAEAIGDILGEQEKHL